jgi:threonine/homoserine/homoserine lactone efflux protein
MITGWLLVALTGWLVSFLGQLPLGSMSLTATQLYVQEGGKSAWLFAVGVAIVEIVYLRLALTSTDWIFQHPVFFTFLGWLTVAFFTVLGVVSFRAAWHQTTEKKGLLINNGLNRFLLGLSLSAMNPAQIPFWLLWSTYMLDLKVLHSSTIEYNYFTIGAGLGTLTGLAVYMYGGNYLITKMKVSNQNINKAMGVIFFIACIFQLYRMWHK